MPKTSKNATPQNPLPLYIMAGVIGVLALCFGGYVLLKPAQPAKLTVTQIATTLDDMLIVDSEKATLLQIDAKAEHQDVYLQKLIIHSPNDTLTAAQNYELWAANANTGMSTEAKWHQKRIVFSKGDGNGYRIPKGKTVRLQVRADVLPFLAGTTQSITLEIAHELTEPYIEAGQKNGDMLQGVRKTFHNDVNTATDTCGETCQMFVNVGHPSSLTFTSSICSNGEIEAEEECDDGNIINGDGCSSSCTKERPMVVSLNNKVERPEDFIDVFMTEAIKSNSIAEADIPVAPGRQIVAFTFMAQAADPVRMPFDIERLIRLKAQEEKEVRPTGYLHLNMRREPDSDYIAFNVLDDPGSVYSEFAMSDPGGVTTQDFMVIFQVAPSDFPFTVEFSDGETVEDLFADAMPEPTPDPVPEPPVPTPAPTPTPVPPVEPGDTPLAQRRDAQRRSDVNTLLNAMYQYAIDNNGNLPYDVPSSAVEICQSDGEKLLGIYLVSLPTDPQKSTPNCTGYTAKKDSNGRITIASPHAETGPVSVTR